MPGYIPTLALVWVSPFLQCMHSWLSRGTRSYCYCSTKQRYSFLLVLQLGVVEGGQVRARRLTRQRTVWTVYCVLWLFPVLYIGNVTATGTKSLGTVHCDVHCQWTRHATVVPGVGSSWYLAEFPGVWIREIGIHLYVIPVIIIIRLVTLAEQTFRPLQTNKIKHKGVAICYYYYIYRICNNTYKWQLTPNTIYRCTEWY